MDEKIALEMLRKMISWSDKERYDDLMKDFVSAYQKLLKMKHSCNCKFCDKK
jgi:hypothetical protein